MIIKAFWEKVLKHKTPIKSIIAQQSIEIRDVTGNTIYSTTARNLKEAVEEAVRKGVDLSNAVLSKADLSNADLSSADLSYAFLIDTILTNANLINADLTGVKGIPSNLTGANLMGAKNIPSSWQTMRQQPTQDEEPVTEQQPTQQPGLQQEYEDLSDRLYDINPPFGKPSVESTPEEIEQVQKRLRELGQQLGIYKEIGARLKQGRYRIKQCLSLS